MTSGSPPQPTPGLDELRAAIENVDRRLLDCIVERKRLSELVAGAKIQTATPFRDRLREDEVLRRIRTTAAELDLDPHPVEHLFRLVIEMSITQQLAHLRDLATTPLRVAYQGVEGSFSHLTAQRRYAGRSGGVLLTGYETFRQAAGSVREGVNDVALLPIENSTAGSINETYDLLAEEGLAINAEVISEISHCLLGVPGATMEGLRMVLSHPQALAQCEKFLCELEGVRTQTEFDTAGAARKVRQLGDPGIAAIASERAATVFGLEILVSGIQTQMSNYTRFVEIATEAAACPPDQPCKTSLMLAIGHHPGDLGEVLRQFSSRRINLTKLESRPVPEQPFRYRFYLDVEGHASSEALREALVEIEPLARGVRILGTYPQAAPAGAESTGDSHSGEDPQQPPEVPGSC
ncbi:MAG TPA: prephenate dehydratase [Thermoanaerobaculia bacterium]|nr:prephenate dehydratase [Thermoanaerobaculia bacterium]